MSFLLARPEFRSFLTHWPSLDFSVPPAQKVRPMMASMPPPPLPDATKVRVHNEVVPGDFEGGGGGELRLLVVGPVGKERETGDTLLVFHGGGFMIGVPEMDLPLLSYFATHGYNCISVDYRLAPESPYPAAYDDAHRAWRYITSPSGAAKVRVNPSRIAIYGSSAGAALATGLARRVRGEVVRPRIVVCDS
ncbi:Alpha/Beta hydrolase protein [Leucosporidium creatinivorum]|uniref:Alpha/Beta hydrolase protein n=1 Tax=Leucosporidium creatinivorum TaxID=106004 RepID=A0A1Y2EZ99_9BASI|nr:Alpha/Beta hydrolase protein [Leucosporidium creatinivorum]